MDFAVLFSLALSALFFLELMSCPDAEETVSVIALTSCLLAGGKNKRHAIYEFPH